jgi:hypothetical protein
LEKVGDLGGSIERRDSAIGKRGGDRRKGGSEMGDLCSGLKGERNRVFSVGLGN